MDHVCFRALSSERFEFKLFNSLKMCQIDSKTSVPADSSREILPDHVKPVHYTVNITPDLVACTFTGSVTILYLVYFIHFYLD